MSEVDMTWAEEEFAGAELGDKRLNRRLMKLTERFADKSTASIPGACPDWSKTQTVYRFFDPANRKRAWFSGLWANASAPPVIHGLQNG
jgi:hypothetical protein